MRNPNIIIYYLISRRVLQLVREDRLCKSSCQACSNSGRGSPAKGLSTILVKNLRGPQCTAFLAGTLITLDFSTNSVLYGLEHTWKEYRSISICVSVDVECIEKGGRDKEENCVGVKGENKTPRGPSRSFCGIKFLSLFVVWTRMFFKQGLLREPDVLTAFECHSQKDSLQNTQE